MIYEIPVTGAFETNCYFYIDDTTNHGFLIDPGAEADRLLGIIKDRKWTIEKILLTHGHFDHFGAVNRIRAQLAIDVYAHEMSDKYLLNPQINLSTFCGPDIVVNNAVKFADGDIIKLGTNPDFALKVIHTPGHTEDSVVFYSKKDKTAFVGDTIFKHSIGNYSYPGGNKTVLVNSIMTKIFTLPIGTVLLSGHSAKTTVGDEKKYYGM